MTIDPDSFPALLHKLVNKIDETIEGNEEAYPTDVKYIERKPRIHDHNNRRHIIHWNDTENVRKEWNRDTYRTVLSEVDDLDLFDKCVKCIEIRSSNRIPEHIMLQNFITHIVDFLLENDTSDTDQIISLISQFISEVDGSPISWNPKIWINGITVDDKPLEIADSTTISTITEEDLMHEVRVVDGKITAESLNELSFAPTAILEFNARSEDLSHISDRIEELLSLMMLYKPCSITKIKTDPNPNKITPLLHNSDISQPTEPSFLYELSQDDEEKLNKFIDKLNPILKSKILKSSEDNYLTIAYDRYKSALMDTHSNESKLTSSIMALEALLLGDNEQGELSERLSKRVDVMLSIFGEQSIEVSRKIKEAYRIRSHYVHGSKYEQQEEIVDLTNRVVDYTRSCIVISLQTSEVMSKKEVINKLDNASLSPAARESLEDSLSEYQFS